MNEAQELLWFKIQNFELDDPTSSFTFTDRLARENGWNIEYSVRAVHEYKKFIFMLCIAEHSLTPSDEIDQIWHLHLLYTRSYWIDFCEETLGRQIHHGPTKGGKQEGEKYNSLYEKTLEFYATIFDKNPPIDIWPPLQIRFGSVNFQRVNIDENWIIKKPSFHKK